MPWFWLTYLYGPAPMGAFRKPSSPTFSTYFLGTIHPGPGGRRAVEGHEVGPRLLHDEAHPARVDHPHLFHALLEELGPAAAVPLEGELHVLRGDGIAVVELDAVSQEELVGEAVLRRRPRLCQARRIEPARHGLDEGIVDRVEDHERRDGRLRLRGVEPLRGQGDVDGKVDLPLGRRLDRRGDRRRERNGERQRGERREAADRSERAHHADAPFSTSAPGAASSSQTFTVMASKA